MKQSILFVDDEPNILQGMKRMLRGLRSEWDMEFANGGETALDIMNNKSVDVIVSDMRMPGMNGGQLLTRVREDYPETIRIALSGYADSELILESIHAIHQFLAKPCDADTLKRTIEQSVSLKQLLENPKLKETVAQVSNLPCLPDIYDQINKVMSSPEGTLAEVGDLISQDIALTAKLLQLVNSAFFGLPRTISSPAEAASYLGLDTLKSLVLNIKLFEQFEGDINKGFMDALWRHSGLASNLAKQIAKHEGQDDRTCNIAAATGMVHDIGKLVLAAYFPSQYEECIKISKEQEIFHTEAEVQVFGTSHDHIGAYMLSIWGLPNSVIEGVAYHHRINEYNTDQFSVPLAVHVAEALAHDVVDGRHSSEKLLNFDYIEEKKLEAWRELAENISAGEE